MFDLPAMPIAFALTLWDAVPIFLSVSLALAVIARATTTARRFASIWRARESTGVEGMAYLVVFMPALLPMLAASSLALILAAWRGHTIPSLTPATPGSALRSRVEETILPVLIAAVVAAYIKVAGPDISAYGSAAEFLTAAVAGSIVGNRSGTVAIPAVSVMVHLGGIVPALACVLTATIHSLGTQIRSSTVTQDPVT